MAFNLMERDYSLHGQIDQPFSLYKSSSHIKSPCMELSRPNNHTSSLSNFQSKGILKAPPPLSLSLLHSAPPPQPPLLPLPASLPRRSFSCPPPAVKIGARNHVKKSTKSMNNIHEKRSRPKKSSDTVTAKNLGPELQPKNIPRAAHDFDNPIPAKDMIMAFTISPPPPSSLPLPTFSLRPKLSCNAAVAAAGIDAGATDDLRRLLRLQ